MKIGYRYSLPVVLLLLPFVYAMFFTFPLGDDFGRAVLANGLFDWQGGLRDLGLNWMRWSGRYTHHFLVVFLGDAVMTRAGYGAVLLGVFSLYGIALYGIFRQLAAGAGARELTFLTLISLLALASGHQALNITYYLETDALGLGIGNAMVLMFVFALCRLWHLPQLRRRDIAFAIFCAVFAIGCYEHSAIATFIAAALALWMAFRCQHPHRASFLLVAKVTLLFFLVSFLAPGNFNRQRIREVSWDRMAEQLLFAGQDWFAIVLQSLHSHFALLALFLGLAVVPRIRNDVRVIPAAKMAAAGALAFVALSAGIVIVHALSDVRVIDTHKLAASMHLLLGAVLAYVSVACAAKLRAGISRVPAAVLVAPVILLFALSTNTTATVRSILTGQLDAYAAGMTQRLQVLGATTHDDVRLAPLKSCPFPACAGEPVPASSTTWPAAYIAALYGQRSVVTAAPDLSRAYASILANPSIAWTRIPGDGFDAAYVAIKPGPNATYVDGWVFARGAPSAPTPAVSVVSVPLKPWGYLPASFELAQREALFSAPSFALTARHRFFGRLQQPRLAAVKPENAADTGVSHTLHVAPLGLADPADVSAIFVSLDGIMFHRLPTSRQ